MKKLRPAMGKSDPSASCDSRLGCEQGCQCPNLTPGEEPPHPHETQNIKFPGDIDVHHTFCIRHIAPSPSMAMPDTALENRALQSSQGGEDSSLREVRNVVRREGGGGGRV
jgi:hypothetical protein